MDLFGGDIFSNYSEHRLTRIYAEGGTNVSTKIGRRKRCICFEGFQKEEIARIVLKAYRRKR